MSTFAPQSSIIYFILSDGYDGSMGTYAPPASKMPNCTMGNSIVLLNKRTTCECLSTPSERKK